MKLSMVRLHERTKTYLLILFIIVLLIDDLFSQSYWMSISNGTNINQSIFEFDILIKSNNNDFELTSYQIALSLDTSASGFPASFSYIENTSELTNIPSVSIGINNFDGSIKLTFASMPGSDNITNQVKRIGRFRVEALNITPAIKWSFSGSVTTILTGAFFENITDSTNHFSELPSSIEPNKPLEDFELSQNYPNPFNPSTNIQFSLPENSKVRLTVFNILGEVVDELVNGEMDKGVHTIQFSAENLVSGIYLYKLDVGNRFSDIRKMILIR